MIGDDPGGGKAHGGGDIGRDWPRREPLPHVWAPGLSSSWSSLITCP
jgi:hypothetical protein